MSKESQITDNYNLATLFPDLVKEWHPIKNGNLQPCDFAPKSNKKVWWKCKEGHEWEASINNRSAGRRCQKCAGKVPTIQYNLAIIFPDIAAQWHPIKNGNLKPHDVTPYSNKKVWWLCQTKHEWSATINNRANGKTCPYCSGRFPTEKHNLAILFPDLVREWHPTKNGTLCSCDCSPKSDKKVWWQCQKKHEWKASVKNRAKGNGCPYCSGRLVSAENNLAILFPELIKEWHPIKNGSKTPYDVTAQSHKKIYWMCPLHHEWLSPVSSRTSKSSGCPHCSKRISKKGTIWLNNLHITIREFPIIIGVNKFIVDGIDVSKMIVYEYLGDYWHGNPQTKNMNDMNKRTHTTYGELFYNTMNRFQKIYNAGYTVIYRWESSKTDEIFTP